MPPAPHPADVAAIQELREAWVAAVARRDPTALADFLTDDYEVWAHAAPPLTGPSAAADAMRGALSRFDIDQRFEPIETVISGDWAFERGIETMRVTPRDGGESRTLTQRALLLMRRGADGRWSYARGMTNGLPTEDGSARPAGAR